MADDHRKQLGQAGEDLAAAHLERRGYRVLDRNFRTRWGELDIVALGDGALAFCEVKTRRGAAPAPLLGVHRGKQIRVRRMAAAWLVGARRRPYAETLRFDAIGVNLDEQGRLIRLDHLEGVF